MIGVVQGVESENDPTTERWAPIPGYEGFYEVSDLGRVRSLDRVVTRRDGSSYLMRGRVLKLILNPRNGYLTVSLSRRGICRTSTVHQLVLLTFVGPCPPGLEVCHNDGVKTNSALSNLRYDTHSSNVQDTIKHGRNWRLSKVECPQSHVLKAPNLVPSELARGGRKCLACSRAQGVIAYRRRSGRPVPDFQALADEYYEKIMEGAA